MQAGGASPPRFSPATVRLAPAALQGKSSTWSPAVFDALANRRSCEIRALEILEQAAGDRMSPALKRRLAAMRPEIRATTHVLEGLDRLRERRYLAAAREIGAAASSPLALARCMAARFGPRSRSVA